MLFILQNDKELSKLDIDLMTLKNELDKQRFQHEYMYMGLEDFEEGVQYSKRMDIKQAVIVGNLNFTQAYLNNVHKIPMMSAIEVPNEMRLDKFLNRKYSIINKDELLTKSGYWFTKYASKLKEFSYTGLVEQLMYTDEGKEPFLKDGLYVFSEVKHILSEYRVFVLNDDIKGIQYYDGDPTIMPTPDEINKIKEMINRYMFNDTRPKAYSLDIAIIDTKIGRDIMILECHPFCSLGLYGLVGSFLPYAYRNGLDWYINHNTPLNICHLAFSSL